MGEGGEREEGEEGGEKGGTPAISAGFPKPITLAIFPPAGEGGREGGGREEGEEGGVPQQSPAGLSGRGLLGLPPDPPLPPSPISRS